MTDPATDRSELRAMICRLLDVPTRPRREVDMTTAVSEAFERLLAECSSDDASDDQQTSREMILALFGLDPDAHDADTDAAHALDALMEACADDDLEREDPAEHARRATLASIRASGHSR